MLVNNETEQDSYLPRLIVWQVSGEEALEAFSTHECLLTIESIARTSKPIVVLTGSHVLARTDIYQIVEYGFVLGLKMIVEVHPRELSDVILQQFIPFGPKVFRVLVDDCIVEDPDIRFKQSQHFKELEDAVRRLKSMDYELHLGATITQPNFRKLAFYHDYAFHRSAHGLYCHLSFVPSVSNNTDHLVVCEMIEALARMKSFSPKNMYISPQCVKYGPRRLSDELHDDLSDVCSNDKEWNHWCLGGKTFAFINVEGIVRVCAGQLQVCGNLRTIGYDFKQIWENSKVFQSLRSHNWTCTETQLQLNTVQETKSYQGI